MFFESWAILVADFQSEYSVDLETSVRDMSFTWRRFAFLATGLLSKDTRIHRRFAPRNDN